MKSIFKNFKEFFILFLLHRCINIYLDDLTVKTIVKI